MFTYFWERETEHEKVRERGRYRIRSRFQALSCLHRAPCGARTHEPWDHGLSRSQRLNQLSHPCTPEVNFLKSLFSRKFKRLLYLYIKKKNLLYKKGVWRAMEKKERSLEKLSFYLKFDVELSSNISKLIYSTCSQKYKSIH